MDEEGNNKRAVIKERSGHVVVGCLQFWRKVTNDCKLVSQQSATFILVAFILELAGGIYILVNGTEYSKLDPWLERRMYKLILDSNYNDRANLALQAIQEKVIFPSSSSTLMTACVLLRGLCASCS